MKQTKARRSNRKAVSKERIAQASYAKKHGLISKKAKLTGGMISRRIAKKLDTLEGFGAIPTFIYQAGMKRARIMDAPARALVKVKPKMRKTLKEQGFEIFGNQVLVPRDKRSGRADKRYVDALTSGRAAGIKRFEAGGFGSRKPINNDLPRVAIDTIEVIVLDNLGIKNYADLHRALILNEISREAKYDDEVYSFTFFGYHPRGVSEFFTDEELLAKLENYKWTDQAFDNFELVRLRMGDTLGPTPDWVYEKNRGRSTRTRQDRRSESAMLKVRRNQQMRIEKSREERNSYQQVIQQRYRDRIAADPAKHARVKEKDRKRKAAARKKDKQ